MGFFPSLHSFSDYECFYREFSAIVSDWYLEQFLRTVALDQFFLIYSILSTFNIGFQKKVQNHLNLSPKSNTNMQYFLEFECDSYKLICSQWNLSWNFLQPHCCRQTPMLFKNSTGLKEGLKNLHLRLAFCRDKFINNVTFYIFVWF